MSHLSTDALLYAVVRNSQPMIPQLLLPLQVEAPVSKTITVEEWTKQRSRIRQLYIEDNMTREETRLIMKHRYGFDASDVQYKYQIKKWEFQKSLTYEQKEHIVTKARYYPKTIFLLCGKRIPKTKVSRQRKGILASGKSWWSLPPNLYSYTPGDIYITEIIREVRSTSTTKCSDPKRLEICCVTCTECELDFFHGLNDNLWDSVLGEHIVGKHAHYSSRFALLWCAVNPALQDAPDHQVAHEFNYLMYDDDDPVSVVQMLELLDEMSSTSVIQEEPEGLGLWLVDRSYDGEIKTLASISRWSDETPKNLLRSLLDEISSQTDNPLLLS